MNSNNSTDAVQASIALAHSQAEAAIRDAVAKGATIEDACTALADDALAVVKDGSAIIVFLKGILGGLEPSQYREELRMQVHQPYIRVFEAASSDFTSEPMFTLRKRSTWVAVPKAWDRDKAAKAASGAFIQRITGLREESVMTPRQLAFIRGTDPEQAEARAEFLLRWRNNAPVVNPTTGEVVEVDGHALLQRYEVRKEYVADVNHVAADQQAIASAEAELPVEEPLFEGA